MKNQALKFLRLGTCLLLGNSAALLAQQAHLEPVLDDAIVVTGERAEQAKAAALQAQAITPRPSGDVPLARHYAPICVTTFGVPKAYGEVIAQQVIANTVVLGLPVGVRGCAPNVWIGFVKDSKAEVTRLRKTDPAMFGELMKFEIDRIFKGSGAVQVWHATEQRNYDGRPIPTMGVGAGGTEVKVNNQYQAGRLVSPIRTDMNGSLVIFDRARANGLTVQQLADYATMRILVPVQDIAKVEPGTVPTILTLFAEGGDPRPDGLTEFDWAYLSGFYRLDRGARASSVHDATRKAMLDGRATGLAEKARGN